MSVSGFSDKFLFYGFLPKKNKEIDTILTILSKYRFSHVFFIPAIKINLYIGKFKNFLWQKNSNCKRTYKNTRAFYREDIDTISSFENNLKGELTIVISGIENKKIQIDQEKLSTKQKNI